MFSPTLHTMRSPTSDLWHESSAAVWEAALARYGDVIERQGVSSLVEHDTWYRHELPDVLRSRQPAFVTHDELVRITEWKMARGVWRARNLMLVRGNLPAEVKECTLDALAQVPHPVKPIATVAKLAGVGPATASAVLSAFAPGDYPFLDELVAAQIPELGAAAFTLGFYGRYAEALRARALQLGGDWTCTAVERALWSNAGGKAGSVD